MMEINALVKEYIPRFRVLISNKINFEEEGSIDQIRSILEKIENDVNNKK